MNLEISLAALMPALLVAVGTGLLILGVAQALRPALAPPDAIVDRMEFYGMPSAHRYQEELQRQSFSERILQPLMRSIAVAVTRNTPRSSLEGLDADLALAGNPLGLSAAGFIAGRVVAAILSAFIAFAIFSIGVGAGPALVAGTALGVAAWLGCGFWLRQAISSRRHQVQRALPDLLDFLVVAVDAGLGFEGALNQIVAKHENALTSELRTVLAQVQLGGSLTEGLEDLGRRMGVPELSSFVQMVGSSERMGVPLAQVLRIQAQEMRWRRGEWARERAARAPVKMTIPMVLLIFPTLWLILLGPSIMEIFSSGL